MDRFRNARLVRAPRGPDRTAQGWGAEAAMRMLMNNLDPEVAERPEELVVYGGIGRAARDWECFDRIVASLKRLEADQTLLVQSGKPVGIFRTHADAPRVLIANSNIVPAWATWEHFHHLDRLGLAMYGQMTAGSWIYIGSQGIVQGTYETFAEAGRQHYGGDLAGRWILTAGLGGMGGAQPLAAVFAGACCLAVECEPGRIEKRLATGYLDRQAATLDEALAIIALARAEKRALSVGLLGNAAEIFPEIVRRVRAGDRAARPDIVTDQTSAHDPRNGYLPAGWTLDRARAAARERPRRGRARGEGEHGGACARHARLPRDGHPDRRLRQQHPPVREGGRASPTRSAFPASCPAYIRPLFCRGIGPFRWAALSGDPEDIYRTDARVKELLPDDAASASLARHGARADPVPGPAGAHLLGRARRSATGSASPSTRWWRAARSSAPIVIGRDHLDSGSVASPNRETEAMRDGSDAVSDWPLLNALLNTASGATWVSLHHGGGVGIGYSQHAGMVIVADGTEDAARRLARVLWNDPGDRRHAPRRCRLRGRDRLRARARARPALPRLSAISCGRARSPAAPPAPRR